MRRALGAAAVLAAALAAGCGGDGGGGGGETAGLPGDSSSRGAQLVAENGCQSCHRIGSGGNSGPGPELTQVGARLSQEEIAGVLVDPPGGMPSFEDLPEADREAIAAYLASLR